ncbi:hypothetical protein [Sporichthya brevicatena]
MRRVEASEPAGGDLRGHLLERRVDRFERQYGRGFECDENTSLRHLDRDEVCVACGWPHHGFWRMLLAQMDADAADIEALRDRTGPVLFRDCEVRVDGLLPYPHGSPWFWYRLDADDSVSAFREKPG